ncbi:MAG: 3'-5' exonuclease [Treponema sp.]|jgi:DNA polymerase-3 subunit epsilon|nr:3'-5' exonuclease [Treponema sp.]
MKDFAAIDFETANGNHSSVCAVGIVIVRDGQISEKYYRLIRPTPNYYWTWFTRDIHGIEYEDTVNEPPFPDVWAELAPRLMGLPLVAHNSSFDEDCLRSVHEAYATAYPGYEFHCTCRAARRVFGKELPNHRLPTVALRCGYNLTQHHHALADAEACAVIAMQVFPN